MSKLPPTHSTTILTIRHKGMVAIGGVFLRVDWMGSEMGLSVFNRPPEWDGWVYWPRSDQGKFAILQAIYDHQLHFAGFGYGRFENLYLLRLPLWFLSLLSVLLLLWIFRRTRAKSPPTAFPIEAGPESSEILMNRLQENIAKHNERYTRPFRLSMSVGIGRINPADCPTVQRLLAEADRELYRRKRDRKAAGGTPSVG